MSDKLNIFGKSHTVLGESATDLILRCRGAIKIQWGNKFIDLIKDGKINSDFKFIYTINTLSDIGSRDGLYITNDGSVYLKSGNNTINLISEEGDVYVSFMGEQQTTSDQKYLALKNIGFIYDSIDQINSDSLQNGIVYIIQEHKLYTIQDGVVSEFSINIPNPFTQQLIIKKDDPLLGSLSIIGEGRENSIAFDSIYLYRQGKAFYVDSPQSICLKIGTQNKVQVTGDSLTSMVDIVSNMIKSPEATSTSGFRIYLVDGKSVIETDSIIVRDQAANENSGVLNPIQWYYKNNIILSVSQSSEDQYELSLMYQNEFEVGQMLYAYVSVKQDSEYYSQILIPMQVSGIDTEHNTIIITVQTDQLDPTLLSSLGIAQLMTSLQNQVIYLIQVTGQTLDMLRISNAIDLISIKEINDADSNNSVTTRIGNLTELNKFEKVNGIEQQVTGNGVYTSNFIADRARYVKDYNLLPDDKSSSFASTEWVHKLLPQGSIIMYNGSSNIPDGWHICDGTENTPNLTGYFIKSGINTGTIETYKVVSGEDTQEGQNIIQFQSYSLIFIMKII